MIRSILEQETRLDRLAVHPAAAGTGESA